MGGWVVFVVLLVCFAFSVFVRLAALLLSCCYHTNNTSNTNNTNNTNNTIKRTVWMNQTTQPKWWFEPANQPNQPNQKYSHKCSKLSPNWALRDPKWGPEAPQMTAKIRKKWVWRLKWSQVGSRRGFPQCPPPLWEDFWVPWGSPKSTQTRALA